MERDALFSPDGTYRYSLLRSWDRSKPPLMWLMLNPSTADASVDDPTIRKVIGFSRDRGYGTALVVNLYGLRSTSPQALRTHVHPVGPGNDDHIRTVLRLALVKDVVAAWGVGVPYRTRVEEVLRLLAGRNVLCLGTTRDGHPKHPLYVPYKQPFEPFAGMSSVDPDERWRLTDDLGVVGGPQEKRTPGEFRVGDRVRVLAEMSYDALGISDKVGTVVGLNVGHTLSVRVRLDGRDTVDPEIRTWNFFSGHLELVND